CEKRKILALKRRPWQESLLSLLQTQAYTRGDPCGSNHLSASEEVQYGLWGFLLRQQGVAALLRKGLEVAHCLGVGSGDPQDLAAFHLRQRLFGTQDGQRAGQPAGVDFVLERRQVGHGLKGAHGPTPARWPLLPAMLRRPCRRPWPCRGGHRPCRQPGWRQSRPGRPPSPCR